MNIIPYREGVFDAMYQILWEMSSGAPFEYPVVTHRFNTHRLPRYVLRPYANNDAVFIKGDVGALPRTGIRWNFPGFGGWNKYVVLRVVDITFHDNWYLCWLTEGEESHGAACSRIPISVADFARARIGPYDTTFIGMTADFEQIPIRLVDSGVIGDDRYGRILLL